MTRHQLFIEWTEGFIAGICPAPCDDKKGEHWQAGYLAGYKMRSAKNAALDEYLVSTGRKPQATIRLAAKD